MVVFASKLDRLIYLGYVTGDITHDPSINEAHPNVRPVRWVRSLPRTVFTQGALYELGAFLTLFRLKTYADEFRRALEGETAPQVNEEDSTVHVVAEEIENLTRDFILRRLSQELKGHPFAEFVAHLLQAILFGK